MSGDTLSVETDKQDGEPLVVPAMAGGKRVAPAETLDAMRARAAQDLAKLPETHRRREAGAAYPLTVAPALEALAREADKRVLG
jgi:nicotinate phosphoribosyltransferase